MSLAAAVEHVLRHLSGDQVRALAATAEAYDHPPTSFGSTLIGGTVSAGDAVEHLRIARSSTPGLTGVGIALALRVGLAATERGDRRRARPVWTGPGAKGQQRLTAGVLHQLIASAQERILLVSFAAHTLSSLAHDLQAAVTRGVEVDVLFETTEDSAGSYKSTDDAPFGAIDGIRRLRWPTEERESGALLHAKALVIDRRLALVGSANLTRRALDANLELGLTVEDVGVAGAIEDHVRRLIADRTIVVDNR